MTTGFGIVAGLTIALGLVSGCLVKENDPEDVGGTGGMGGDDTRTPTRPELEQVGVGGSGVVDPGISETCDGVVPLPPNIESDLTVGPGCVKIDNTVLSGAAKLTILPGTRVEFFAGGFLSVAAYGGAATLAAVGTPDEPIVFTSSNANPRAGDWQCIYLGGDGSELDNVIVEYGGASCEATGAGNEGMVQIYGSARGVTHSTLRDSSTVAVRLDGTPTLFENNTFERNTLAPIRVGANSITSIGTPNTYDPDDVIIVEPDGVTRGGTWANHGVPYRFLAGFGIQSEIKVAAGVRVEMTDGSLEVGSFDLLGTAAAPVVFTSAQEVPRPGDWGCIFSRGGALRIEHALIEYAGSGQGCSGSEYRVGVWAAAGTTISDSVFRNIEGAAFKSDCGDDISDWCANTFENVSEGPISCADELRECP
jgi:hypothetical protein